MNTLKNSILGIVLLFMAVVSYAQAPQGINYQAVIRNGAGALVATQLVEMRFTIYTTSATGTMEYQETKNLTTNQYGLVTHVIGTGNVVSGTFSSISWSSDLKFLQAEVNTGSGFVDLGTTQLVSVPYALNAKTADALTGGAPGYWYDNGNDIYANNSGNVGIGTSTPSAKLDVRGRGYLEDATPITGNYLDLAFNIRSSGSQWGAMCINASTTAGQGVLLWGRDDVDGGLQVCNNNNIWAQVQASAFNVMSDLRVKNNIQEIGKNDFESYLAQIRSIESAKYFYNFEPSRKVPHIGVIAQTLPREVQVEMGDRGGAGAEKRIGLSLSDLSGLSLVGIKALDSKQQDMEKTIADLQQQITVLTQKLDDLTKK